MSYNLSCSISKQTILPGQPCVLMPIVRQRDFMPVTMSFRGKSFEAYGISGSDCYADAFWSPAAYPVTGVYSDRGCFDLDATTDNLASATRFLLKLYQHSPEVEEGKDSLRDIAFDLVKYVRDNCGALHEFFAVDMPGVQKFIADSEAVRRLDPGGKFMIALTMQGSAGPLAKQIISTWDYAWRVMSENRLFLKTYAKDAADPVKFAVMHKPAYDYLVGLPQQGKNCHDEPLDQASAFGRSFDKAIDTAIEFAVEQNPDDERVAALAGSTWPIRSLDELLLDRRKLSEEARIEQMSIEMHFKEALSAQISQSIGHASGSTPAFIYRIIHTGISKAMYARSSKQELFDQLRPALDAMCALGGMELLNLKYEPAYYAGRDSKNQYGQNYSKFISAVAAEVTYNDDETDYSREHPVRNRN